MNFGKCFFTISNRFGSSLGWNRPSDKNNSTARSSLWKERQTTTATVCRPRPGGVAGSVDGQVKNKWAAANGSSTAPRTCVQELNWKQQLLKISFKSQDRNGSQIIKSIASLMQPPCMGSFSTPETFEFWYDGPPPFSFCQTAHRKFRCMLDALMFFRAPKAHKKKKAVQTD